MVASIARGLYKRPSQVSAYAGGGARRDLRALPEAGAGGALPERRGAGRATCAVLPGGRAGREDGSAAALLTDPERFEAGVRPKVADAAVAQARQHAGGASSRAR